MIGKLRRAAPLLLLASCAYFNGIYNAHEQARHAEKHLRAGREAEAAAAYMAAAVKAETVLARYPKSRWSTEALYVAGVGEAMSEQCPQAINRLEQFLSRNSSDEKRERASVALASCYVRQGKYSRALDLLEPALASKKKEVRERATLWAARSAMAMGDNVRANSLLSTVDLGATQWELAAASMQGGDYARAESLYALRGAHADFREELLTAMRELWAEGRRDQVLGIVARYEPTRLRSSHKARIYLTAAELLTHANQDSAARALLLKTRRLSTDSLLDREASARLTMLSLASMGSLLDVKNTIAASRENARNNPLQRRLEENVLLVSLLERSRDPSGAALFLAGEVARDSLRARALAAALFLRAADPSHGAVIAPKALLAAAAMEPDSAEAYHAQLRTRFPSSPYVMMLNGAGPEESPVLTEGDRLLRAWWDSAVKFLADTLRTLRPDTTRPPGTSSISAGSDDADWMRRLMASR
jgi:tetratricopeptide (TPR) repeat protein